MNAAEECYLLARAQQTKQQAIDEAWAEGFFTGQILKECKRAAATGQMYTRVTLTGTSRQLGLVINVCEQAGFTTDKKNCAQSGSIVLIVSWGQDPGPLT
jgi:2-oxoglutarate dehydrogenase complex dehydrogenase (E1) component-like enzyme